MAIAPEMERFRKAACRRFEDIDPRLEAIERRLADQAGWVGIVFGGFQVRAGHHLEDAVASTLRNAIITLAKSPEIRGVCQRLGIEPG